MVLMLTTLSLGIPHFLFWVMMLVHLTITAYAKFGSSVQIFQKPLLRVSLFLSDHSVFLIGSPMCPTVVKKNTSKCLRHNPICPEDSAVTALAIIVVTSLFPYYRLHHPCWRLSPVFSPRVVTARKAPEKEPSIQPQPGNNLASRANHNQVTC